jgi:hypothetical protein
MAKQEFLGNFRVARKLFMHPQVQADSSRIDPQAVEERLVRAAIWLTPKSVKGFSPDDFAELGPARQRELSDAIQEFLSVAQQVPPTAPATPEQVKAASPAFAKALAILQPYLPTPEEWRKIEEALRTVDLPSWVVNWDYELGSDHEGEAAVWVTIFADEHTAPRKTFGRFSFELGGKIHNALSAAGIKRWPYIRMRTAVEHKTA